MGSGKSTTGRRLARALGWRFVDADREVEREAGRSIPEIFAEEGESAFRALEHRVTQRLLERDQWVVASGGGWPCRPGRLEGLAPDTGSVWLKASPDTVWERTHRSPTRRPLLEVPDPRARIRELLAERQEFYRKARWTVDTDGRTTEEVVRAILLHLDNRGGDTRRP
jgi:shikimate kinase